jgi:hypothetical protein
MAGQRETFAHGQAIVRGEICQHPFEDRWMRAREHALARLFARHAVRMWLRSVVVADQSEQPIRVLANHGRRDQAIAGAPCMARRNQRRGQRRRLRRLDAGA